MDDERTAGNGSSRWPQPRLPIGIVVASLVLAVGVVSVLIYVLYLRTTGPGQVLRSFYEEVAAGDCEGSFDLLSTGLQAQVDQEAYCGWVDERRGTSTEFAVETGYFGEIASSTVLPREPGTDLNEELTWTLERSGRTWRIAAFPDDLGPPFL